MISLKKIICITFSVLLVLAIIFAVSSFFYIKYCVHPSTFKLAYSHPMKACMRKEIASNSKYYRILVIRGGAMHGLLPAHILDYISKKAHQPIPKLFDMIVASSTGGIIASLLSIPAAHSRTIPKYTTGDVIKAYSKLGHELLRKNRLNSFLTAQGLLAPRYSGRAFAKAYVQLAARNLKFRDLVTKLVIPTYSITTHRTLYLNSYQSGCHGEPDYTLLEVLSAATATPGFFPPVTFDYDKSQNQILIDGGIENNNPALYAIKQALPILARKKVLIVIVGTGHTGFHYLNENTTVLKGFDFWLIKSLKLAIMGQNKSVMNAVALILDLDTHKKLKIFNFNQADVSFKYGSFDTRPSAIAQFNSVSINYVNNHKNQLNLLTKFLLEKTGRNDVKQKT